MIDPQHSLPLAKQAKALGISRGRSTSSPARFRLPILLFSGENYRLKAKRRAGVLVKRQGRWRITPWDAASPIPGKKWVRFQPALTRCQILSAQGR